MDEETLKQLEGRGEVPTGGSESGSRPEEIDASAQSSSSTPLPDEQLMPPPIGHGHADTNIKAVPGSSATGGSRSRHSNSLAHNRSMSLAEFPGHSKRLSLHLPPSFRDANAARLPRPPSWASSPLLTPTEGLASPDGRANQPPTETNFLTALAAQERRVLELKEELARAEGQLERLKKQWANYEKQRKRQDDSSPTRLEPLAAPLARPDDTPNLVDTDGSAAWMQREMARRRQLLGGVQRGNRKVFSGGKHARTLSLLTPDRVHTPSFPQPAMDDEQSRQPPTPAATPTVTEEGPNGAQNAEDLWIARSSIDLSLLPSEALLKTGKQMASGIRDGLWTFFEDIRQATIGEEPITGSSASHRPHARHARSKTSPHGLRKHGSRQSLARSSISSTGTATAGTASTLRDQADARSPQNRRPPAESDILKAADVREDTLVPGDDLELTSDPPARHPAGKAAQERTPRKVDRPPSQDSESWDAWGTPVYGESASPQGASVTSASEMEGSLRSTPRTSTSSASVLMAASLKDGPSRGRSAHQRDASTARDAIPWPALAKFTPSQLKRTASNLMSEWEKSLTPSPSQEDTRPAVEDDVDYIL